MPVSQSAGQPGGMARIQQGESGRRTHSDSRQHYDGVRCVPHRPWRQAPPWRALAHPARARVRHQGMQPGWATRCDIQVWQAAGTRV